MEENIKSRFIVRIKRSHNLSECKSRLCKALKDYWNIQNTGHRKENHDIIHCPKEVEGICELVNINTFQSLILFANSKNIKLYFHD